MHPYEIAAVCRLALFVVAIVALIIGRKRFHGDHLAQGLVLAGVITSILPLTGLSRGSVSAIALPYTAIVVSFVLSRAHGSET